MYCKQLLQLTPQNWVPIQVYQYYCFTATLRFSQTAYTFAEEDGVGAVMVEGTPGFTARVFGRK